MEDFKHYLLLMAMLSVGFGLFWIFNFNRQTQVILISGIGLIYFLWGIIYHFLRKELHWRLVVEYLIISLFAALSIITLLLRA